MPSNRKSSEKKAYQRPQLVIYGTIQHITQMTATDGRLDNGTKRPYLFTALR